MGEGDRGLGRPGRLSRRGFVLAGLLALAPIGADAQELADPPPGIYRYTVRALFGAIGTYTIRIERAPEETVVTSRILIDSTMLGRHLEGERVERWQAGRLVAFRSETFDSGAEIHVEGHAEPGRFILSSARDGILAAPEDVFAANPWTIRMTRARTLFNTQWGTVTPATITETDPEWLEIGGSRILARRFTVAADRPGELWFSADDRQLPVRFASQTRLGFRVRFELDALPGP